MQVAAGVGAASLLCGAALANVPPYSQTGLFTLPTASSVFDVAADGRTIVVSEDGTVRREVFPTTGSFAPIGSLPSGLVPSFGAGFMKVSPDGAHLAVGDNGTVNQMWIVPTAGLTTSGPTPVQSINVPNFDAAWTTNGRLYVNGSPNFGSQPSLYRVDVAGGTSTAVVSGIGDGSGGVAARAGRVYTAIGYDASPGSPNAGLARSFDAATLDAATVPVAFSTGVLAAQANSGSSLGFDNGGDLIIAGAGGVAVFDLATSQRYDLPGLSSLGFYSATWNAVTGEILVRDYGSATVERYGIVPGPGSLAVLACAGSFGLARRGRRGRDLGVCESGAPNAECAR
jgi:hypothetical protein